MHLGLLPISVYIQVTAHECYLSGVVTALLLPPPQSCRRAGGPSLAAPHLSRLQSLLPCCSVLFS